MTAATGAARGRPPAPADPEIPKPVTPAPVTVRTGGGSPTAPAGSGVPERGRRRRVAGVAAAVVAAALALLAVVVVPRIGDEERTPAAGPTAGTTEPAGATGGAAGGVPPTGATTGGAPSAAPTTTPARTTSAPTRTPGQGAAVAAPAGFTRYTDPRFGFSVVVPAGWRPRVKSATIVDFQDPSSSRYLRIDTAGAGTGQRVQADPYANWVASEQAFRNSHTGYRKVNLSPVRNYRPEEGWTVADWEFLVGGTHTLNRNIRVSDTRAHALYLSAPDSQWDDAATRQVWNLAAASFVPAPVRVG